MQKGKKTRFSATKAVKANARKQIGQPKPARVLETRPKQGRREKHPEQLEKMDWEEK